MATASQKIILPTVMANVGGGEEKRGKKEIRHFFRNSPASFLDSHTRYDEIGHQPVCHQTSTTASFDIRKPLHLPNQVLGFDSGGFHSTPNNGRAGNIDSPGEGYETD